MKAISSLPFAAALFLMFPSGLLAGEVPPGSSCESDDDCPSGHYCVVVCQVEPSPFECLVDDDCPDDGVCVDGCCSADGEPCSAPVMTCDSDEDCPPGALCLDGCCSDGDECLPGGNGGHECYGYCEPYGGEFSHCESDEDCGEGWYCLTISFETCYTEGSGEVVCEVESESACVPDWFVECETDADCGDDLVCNHFVEEDCRTEGSACEPGGECPPPVEVCESVEFSFCTPEYLSQCVEDDDCGEGFTCRPEEVCVCSGHDGGPDDPGDGAPPPGGEECECIETDIGWCELEIVPCDEDADCLDGWTCHMYGYPGSETTCHVDEDGNTHCEEDDTELSHKGYCVPPYWEYFTGGGGGYDGDPEREPGEEDDREVGANGNGDETGDDDSDSPAAGDDEGDQESEKSSFGCSAAGSTKGGASLLFLAALGMLLLGRAGRGRGR